MVTAWVSSTKLSAVKVTPYFGKLMGPVIFSQSEIKFGVMAITKSGVLPSFHFVKIADFLRGQRKVRKPIGIPQIPAVVDFKHAAWAAGYFGSAGCPNRKYC